jgi:hypothetical protein
MSSRKSFRRVSQSSIAGLTAKSTELARRAGSSGAFHFSSTASRKTSPVQPQPRQLIQTAGGEAAPPFWAGNLLYHHEPRP